MEYSENNDILYILYIYYLLFIYLYILYIYNLYYIYIIYLYILYIYSTNIGTEYFKHGIYSSSFSLQNAVCFIILTCLVPVLFTFYIQVC